MIGTIDSNIWIYAFDRKNPGHQNIRKWLNENLEKMSLRVNIIVVLEVLHNLTKDPRVEFEIPFSYVNDILSLSNIEIIDLKLINFRIIANNLASLRHLGIGGRDAIILSVLKEGETIITHDKNLLMNTTYRRIDPYFDPTMIIEVNKKFDPLIFKENFDFMK